MEPHIYAIFFSIVRAIALMMEAASTFETWVNFYQITWRSNPENSHLQQSTCFV
jgi:hypothetical protein